MILLVSNLQDKKVDNFVGVMGYFQFLENIRIKLNRLKKALCTLRVCRKCFRKIMRCRIEFCTFRDRVKRSIFFNKNVDNISSSLYQKLQKQKQSRSRITIKLKTQQFTKQLLNQNKMPFLQITVFVLIYNLIINEPFMNSFKYNRDYTSLKNHNSHQDLEKNTHLKKSDVLNSLQNISDSRRSKADEILKQKIAFINLCAQLKKENQLLEKMNKIHINQTQNIKEEIKSLQLNYERLTKKVKQDKKAAKTIPFCSQSKQNRSQNYSVLGFESQIQSIRSMLGKISVCQNQEYKTLNSRYKQLQLQIRNVKKLIEKQKTRSRTKLRINAPSS